MSDISNQTFIDNFISSNFDEDCLNNIIQSHLYTSYEKFSSNYNEKEKNIIYISSNYDMNKFLYSYNNLSFSYIDKLFDGSNSSNTKTFINYLCYKSLSNINIIYGSNNNYYDICKNIKPVVRNILYDNSKTYKYQYQSNFNVIIENGDLYKNTEFNNINHDKSAIHTKETDCYLFKSNSNEIYKVNEIFNISNLKIPIYIDKLNDYIYLIYKKDDDNYLNIRYKYYNDEIKCSDFVLDKITEYLNDSTINKESIKNTLDSNFIYQLNNSDINYNNRDFDKHIHYCNINNNNNFTTYNTICSKIINNILLLDNNDFEILKNAYNNFSNLN